MKHRWSIVVATLFAVWIQSQRLPAQAPESESISITPLIYGIEKGFYRKEGIDLQFRVLRSDLAVSSIVSGKDVDYMYGAGTAAIMPVPWNFRMKQEGFKELIYAGKVMSQPLTGLATSKDKMEKQPDQARRMLRAFIRSMKAMKEDRKGVTDFIAKRFSLDGPTAEETYKIMIKVLGEW